VRLATESPEQQRSQGGTTKSRSLERSGSW